MLNVDGGHLVGGAAITGELGLASGTRTSRWSCGLAATAELVQLLGGVERRAQRPDAALTAERLGPGDVSRLTVELRGFEPLTSSMPWRRATNCAIAPRCGASLAGPPGLREIEGKPSGRLTAVSPSHERHEGVDAILFRGERPGDEARRLDPPLDALAG